MPGVDWIPGVSQTLSIFEIVTGDFEGAIKTQKNFVKQCPVISQLTSLFQLVAGNPKGALKTQKRCLKTVDNIANRIPIVGHVKGVVHHMVGDQKGGDQAINAATRSTVVIASEAVAGLPPGDDQP